ncbi:MAG: PD-(D/E)XK nuclease family protein [Candidatus Thermoplasmatota archaeon]|nr:PD-(D/E)XK nuclease family protein [Candidatus Thermoplasmatota archaeon]
MQYVIRTSDRAAFKRCRRRWNWSSHLRSNLEPTRTAEPLWTGTGIHFALEDYHGHNRYGSPSDAFRAFTEACRKLPKRLAYLPDGWREELDLALGMLDYYLVWLEGRDPLKTYWINGKPQVEVHWEIEIPWDENSPFAWRLDPGDTIVHRGRFDRVVIDEHGRLWIVEYKSAKRFEVLHFETDGQCSTYSWSGSCLYDQEISGIIYQQHRKDVPDEPKFLKSSGKYSTNKSQLTTSRLYRKALINLYGDIDIVPSDNIKMLNLLHEQETEDSDKFVRRDRIERSPQQIQAEGAKILLELEDLVNDELPLYPSPTRDCSYCPFVGPCVAFDDGSDWEELLSASTKQREEEPQGWRQRLPEPGKLQLQQVQAKPPVRLQLPPGQ